MTHVTKAPARRTRYFAAALIAVFFLSSAPAWALVADNSVAGRSIVNRSIKAVDIAKAAIRPLYRLCPLPA